MTIQTQLIEVAKKVGGVGKGGRNDAQRYDYVRATDVVQATKGAFLDAGLFVSLSLDVPTVTVLDRGDKPQGVLYTVAGSIIVENDKGERVERGVIGSGIDFGGDKGAYKAITGAWKYGLRTLLQIPDEADDPEVERPDERVGSTPPPVAVAPTDTRSVVRQDRGRTPHVTRPAAPKDEAASPDGWEGF